MKRNVAHDKFLALLRDPPAALALDLGGWNELLLLARRSGLLARFGGQLCERDLLKHIPPKARDHIGAAFIATESSQTAVRLECNRVLRAFGPGAPPSPLILLKGAAYLAAGLPLACRRYVGDLDLMVPREHIGALEQALISRGWARAALDDYDQRYYREWSHEIPPMIHPERETPLDIHHTIVPLTSRLRPDTRKLLAASVALPDSRLRVLGPADMVLHSAVHLFNDEVGKPLRDLADLHDLLNHFSTRSDFWTELVARAELHGLGRPLYYALRYTRRLFGTIVPELVLERAAVWAPRWPLLPLMDWIFERRFLPDLPGETNTGAAFARWLHFVRAHWLRMPPLLLARHLAVKSARRFRERWQRKSEGEQ